MKTIAKSSIEEGMSVIDLIAEIGLVGSKGDARRMLKQNAIAINTEKVNDSKMIDANDLISDKYLLAYKGKKDKLIVKVE